MCAVHRCDVKAKLAIKAWHLSRPFGIALPDSTVITAKLAEPVGICADGYCHYFFSLSVFAGQG